MKKNLEKDKFFKTYPYTEELMSENNINFKDLEEIYSCLLYTSLGMEKYFILMEVCLMKRVIGEY